MFYPRSQYKNFCISGNKCKTLEAIGFPLFLKDSPKVSLEHKEVETGMCSWYCTFLEQGGRFNLSLFISTQSQRLLK